MAGRMRKGLVAAIICALIWEIGLRPWLAAAWPDLAWPDSHLEELLRMAAGILGAGL